MLTATGGKITFSATATDTTAAISNVIAELYQDGNPYTNSGLSNGGSGNVYTGSFNLPANPTSTTSIWTVRIRTSSTAGKTIYAPDLTVTVIGDTGLSLTNAAVTPTTLTAYWRKDHLYRHRRPIRLPRSATSLLNSTRTAIFT